MYILLSPSQGIVGNPETDCDFCNHLSRIFFSIPIVAILHRMVFRVFSFFWDFMPLRIIIGNWCSRISSFKIQVFSFYFVMLNVCPHVRVVHQNHDRTEFTKSSVVFRRNPWVKRIQWKQIGHRNRPNLLKCLRIIKVYKIFHSIIVMCIPSNTNQLKRSKCYKPCPRLSTLNNPKRYPGIPTEFFGQLPASTHLYCY